MTFDNGPAFFYHEKMAKALGIKTYFTRPYTSKDKCRVENRNRLIKHFFSKKTDFNLVDTRELRRVEKMINSRPFR